MNTVVLAPAGCGSLSDEIVLGGLLRHLAAHTVTVLSLNQAKTHAMHGVSALTLSSPGSLASEPAAWKAIESAKLFIVASAGVLSEKGKTPARTWLYPLELASRMDVKTAVVGAGALEISDLRERARVQRFLHNFTGSISVRDEQSKRTLSEYGLSASRVSANGDPGLALLQKELPPAGGAPRAAVILGCGAARSTFGFEPQPPSDGWVKSTRELLSQLLKETPCGVLLVRDDTEIARQFAAKVMADLPAGRIEVRAADCALPKLQQAVAACQAVFSQTLHGLILAATCGRPASGVCIEVGMPAFLASLGLGERALAGTENGFDPAGAARHLRELLAQAPELSAQVKLKAAVLARKEAQDARMLEYLVPKRDRFPPRPPKPGRKKSKPGREDAFGQFSPKFSGRKRREE